MVGEDKSANCSRFILLKQTHNLPQTGFYTVRNEELTLLVRIESDRPLSCVTAKRAALQPAYLGQVLTGYFSLKLSSCFLQYAQQVPHQLQTY